MGGEQSKHPRRRTLLKAGVTAATVGFAGCGGSGSGRTDTPSKRGATSTGTEDRGRTATESATKTGDQSGGDDGAWPLHHRDARNTSFAPDLVGPGETLDRAFHWRFPVPEDAPEDGSRAYNYSSPVVAEGRVFCAVAGTYLSDGDDYDRYSLVALDASTGDVLWKRPVEPSSAGTPAPPIYADGTVVHGWVEMRGFDPTDGTVRWTLSEATLSYWYTVVDGTVFIAGRAGDVSAYDVEQGTERWEVPMSATGNPAVDGSDVVVTTSSEAVVLDRATGEERWRTEHDAFPSVLGSSDDGLPPGQLGTPVLDDDTVYAAGGNSAFKSADHGGLVAFDRATGETLWTVDVEAELGEYATPTPGERFSDPTGLYGPPALAGDTLYVRGMDGLSNSKLFAVDAETGAVAWEADTAGIGLFVQVVDGVVYAVSGNHVEAFDRTSGAVLDSAALDDLTAFVSLPAAVGSGGLYVPTVRGIVGYE